MNNGPGILRLKHQRDTLEAIGAEMVGERGRIHNIRAVGPSRAVSAFNLFQTPEPLAERMAVMIPEGSRRVLEPSAGLGRLYRAVRRVCADAEIVLVEQSADCCAELYRQTEHDRRAKLVQGDFMEHSDRERFDCVLMNPPFKQGRDIKHIERAAQMLRPGGLLIGLCLDGPRQNKKLRPLCDSWEPLGPDVFKDEGTRAPVVLLTIQN